MSKKSACALRKCECFEDSCQSTDESSFRRNVNRDTDQNPRGYAAIQNETFLLATHPTSSSRASLNLQPGHPTLSFQTHNANEEPEVIELRRHINDLAPGNAKSIATTKQPNSSLLGYNEFEEALEAFEERRHLMSLTPKHSTTIGKSDGARLSSKTSSFPLDQRHTKEELENSKEARHVNLRFDKNDRAPSGSQRSSFSSLKHNAKEELETTIDKRRSSSKSISYSGLKHDAKEETDLETTKTRRNAISLQPSGHTKTISNSGTVRSNNSKASSSLLDHYLEKEDPLETVEKRRNRHLTSEHPNVTGKSNMGRSSSKSLSCFGSKHAAELQNSAGTSKLPWGCRKALGKSSATSNNQSFSSLKANTNENDGQDDDGQNNDDQDDDDEDDDNQEDAYGVRITNQRRRVLNLLDAAIRIEFNKAKLWDYLKTSSFRPFFGPSLDETTILVLVNGRRLGRWCGIVR